MPAAPPDSIRRDRLVGYACAALVVLVWSSFSLASRFSARPGEGVRLTPWDLGALRYAVAWCVGLLLWLAGAGRGLPWRRAATLALFGGFGFALPSYAGFSLAPAAHGALINSGTLPFIVAIALRAITGERWSRSRQFSLALLLAGFVLFGIEAYAHQTAPLGAWHGDLLFLVASSSWAAYTILARRWSPTPMQAVVAVGLWCAPLYLPLWWLALPSHLAAAPAGAPLGEILFQAFFQGIVAVLVALALYTSALRRIGANHLTTITAAVPGVTALLAIPLLGEPLGALALAGLALVCAAVALGMGKITFPSALDTPSPSGTSPPDC